jgi:hypothetical protein
MSLPLYPRYKDTEWNGWGEVPERWLISELGFESCAAGDTAQRSGTQI